jgi:hypothetical protein
MTCGGGPQLEAENARLKKLVVGRDLGNRPTSPV